MDDTVALAVHVHSISGHCQISKCNTTFKIYNYFLIQDVTHMYIVLECTQFIDKTTFYTKLLYKTLIVK